MYFNSSSACIISILTNKTNNCNTLSSIIFLSAIFTLWMSVIYPAYNSELVVLAEMLLDAGIPRPTALHISLLQHTWFKSMTKLVVNPLTQLWNIWNMQDRGSWGPGFTDTGLLKVSWMFIMALIISSTGHFLWPCIIIEAKIPKLINMKTFLSVDNTELFFRN